MKYRSSQTALTLLIKHDIRVALKQAGGMAYPLLFFVIATSLFPLAIGSEPDLIRKAGSGIIWVMALLASLLPLHILFEEDDKDGTLEQLLVAGVTPPFIAMAKLASYWFSTFAPLILVTPLAGMMLMLGSKTLLLLLVSLLLGTPTLCLINAMAAALMLGARRNAGLVFLVALPLTVPVLIFGAAAGGADTLEAAKAALLCLLALLMIFLPISVTLCSIALKE